MRSLAAAHIAQFYAALRPIDGRELLGASKVAVASRRRNVAAAVCLLRTIRSGLPCRGPLARDFGGGGNHGVGGHRLALSLTLACGPSWLRLNICIVQ